MWLIKSFKSELPSNIIFISNFYGIVFHKNETAWSPFISKRKGGKVERERGKEGIHVLHTYTEK